MGLGDFKKYSRGYFQMFFKRWQGIWGPSEPFILIYHGTKDFELLFFDQIKYKSMEPLLFKDLKLHLKLRILRKKSNKTLREWAKELELTESNLASVERGRRKMGPKLRSRINDFLKPLEDELIA